MRNNDRRALIAINALVNCLSHKIRTPLSVISNELNVVKLSLETDDCDRAIERCRDISAILKNLSNPFSSTAKEEEFQLKEILPDCPGQRLQSLQELTLHGDKRQLTLALDYLYQLLKGLPGANRDNITCSLENMNESKKAWPEIVFSTPPHPLFLDAECEERTDSLTEFFSYKLDIGSTAAPVADAILWAHGCDIVVVSKEELKVHLSFKID